MRTWSITDGVDARDLCKHFTKTYHPLHPFHVWLSRVWIITISGAEGTIYAGENFRLRVSFPEDYPTKPPAVYFLQSPPPPKHQVGQPCLVSFAIRRRARCHRSSVVVVNRSSPARWQRFVGVGRGVCVVPRMYFGAAIRNRCVEQMC